MTELQSRLNPWGQSRSQSDAHRSCASEVKTAARVARDSERILADAREQAERVITEAKERAAVSEKEQHQRPAETSPFITCGHCTMEFRKTDLPPGGKCPVCGRSLNVDAD
jgi:rubrerythrin